MGNGTVPRTDGDVAASLADAPLETQARTHSSAKLPASPKRQPVKWEKQLDGSGRVTAWMVKNDQGMAIRHITKIDGTTRRMRRGIPPEAQWKAGSRYYASLAEAKRAEGALLLEKTTRHCVRCDAAVTVGDDEALPADTGLCLACFNRDQQRA